MVMDLVIGSEIIDHLTDPNKIDTDNDNFLDGYEISSNTNPNDPLNYPDLPQEWYDLINERLEGNETLILAVQALALQNEVYLGNINDTLTGDVDTLREVLDELGITVGDTDYDGLDDLQEIEHGTSITCSDTDIDNLSDAFEIKIGTDPLDDDSDDDGYYDGYEVMLGTNPLDALDFPVLEESESNFGRIMLIISSGLVGVIGIILQFLLLNGKELENSSFFFS